jgi:hypothetical protein
VKFIVINYEKVEADLGPDAARPEEIVVEDRVDVEFRKVELCDDLRSLYTAVRACEERKCDWSVWEVVEGKTVSRALMFEKDGKSVKAVV